MSKTLRQLAELGAEYRDPIAVIDWSSADESRPWLPPEVLSLAGLPAQAAMDTAMLNQFSRVEFARLCAAGLWLEGLLISRVMKDGCLTTQPAEARVMLQEVREEAGHSLMFVEMIDRAGLGGVPLLGDVRLLSWVAHRLHPDSAEFWAMVYIGESVTDSFALKALRAENGAICPLARAVLQFHHKDEARHIAAARTLLKTRVAAMSAPRRWLFRVTLRFLLKRFLRATLYPTEASLRAMGIPDPAGAASAAAQSPARRAFAEDCAFSATRFIERTVIAQHARACPERRVGPGSG
jgi:hypothetical protein